MTEPDAGTDTTNISTRATKVEGGYRIRGRKIWNSKAHIAEKCLLLTRTTPLEDVRTRTDGMTLFLVDLQVPAVDIRPIPKLGRNAVASCEVSFDDVFVADDDLVGEEGRGFHHLLDGLNPERILLAAEALGIGRVALRRAVAYANERVVFGRPIGKNQGISFPLADAHMRLRAAEMMIREASARYDAGLPCGEEANTAKYLAADAAYEAADRACRRTAGWGTPPSTTWSATGARPGSSASPRSPRRWSSTTSPSTCSDCPGRTSGLDANAQGKFEMLPWSG